MMGADWLARLPVIGGLPPGEAAVKLREVGEDEIADALARTPESGPGDVRGVVAAGDRAGPGVAAYRARGRLPGAGRGPGSGLLPIRHAANIAADEGLEGARIKVTLDGLRVADYPGRGMHRILFDFAARNQTDQGAEQLHFNATFRAAEGEQAAVLGRPVFSGLRVGGEGIFLAVRDGQRGE